MRAFTLLNIHLKAISTFTGSVEVLVVLYIKTDHVMFAIGKSKKLVKYSNFRFDQFFVRFEM